MVGGTGWRGCRAKTGSHAHELGTPSGGQTVLEQQKTWLANEEKKEKRLKTVRDKIEQSKSKLRALMEIEVTLEDGTVVKAFGDQDLLDPNQQFDAVHHVHQTTEDSLSMADMERLRLGCEALADLRNQLTGTVRPTDWPAIYDQVVVQGATFEEVAEQRMVSPETIQKVVQEYTELLQNTGAKPGDKAFDALLREQTPITDEDALFSDLEIRQELFDPLKRERIIPDNEIEDRFNQTYQVFRGASEGYQAALLEFSETAEEDPELTQLRVASQKGIKNVAKIGTDLVKLLGKLSESKDVEAISDMAANVLKITESVGQLTITTVDAYYGKQAEGIVDQVGAVLESSLKASLGSGAADYAKWMRAGFHSVTNAKGFCTALMKREEGSVTLAMEQLAEGLEKAFSIGSNDKCQRIGKALKQAVLAGVNTPKIYSLLQEDPPAYELAGLMICRGITSVCKDVLGDNAIAGYSEVVSETVSGSSKEELEEKQKDAEDEFGEAIDELAGTLEEGIGGVSSHIEEARAQLKQELADPVKQRELAEQLKLESNTRLKDSIEDELRQSQIPSKEDDDLEREFIAIQPLIDDVKRAQVYLKLAESIVSAGPKAIAQFFAVAGIAASGKDFIQNVIVGYGKWRQLNEWKDLRQDALIAASISGSSFAAKIKDLQVEFSEASIKAFLSALETAGGILTGGTSEILKTAGGSGGALLEIVLEGRKASDLTNAWNAYREALRNPGDRIRLREAIEKNSTLSKYALAYAALHDGDPLAKAGLAKVGLTEEVLRDPSAKVSDVVQYLQAVWSSDPNNMKKVFRPADWQSDVSGDLSLGAWMSNMTAAASTKLGEDAIVNSSSGVVEGCFLELQTVSQKAAQTQLQKDKELELTEADLQKTTSEVQKHEQKHLLCKDVEQELKSIQTTIRQADKTLSQQRTDPAWANMTTRADILEKCLAQLAKSKQELTDICQRIEEDTSQADVCLKLVDNYLLLNKQRQTTIQNHLESQQLVLNAYDALQKALRGFKPSRSDGKSASRCASMSPACSIK